MLTLELPDEPLIVLAHLVLDLNGTLTRDGELIEGIEARLERLRRELDVYLLSADTFGTAQAIADRLHLPLTRVPSGKAKAEIVESLGADSTVAIGNGRNDVAMFVVARVSIAVLGPEGVATAAMAAADLVAASVTDALDLLVDRRRLVATLRR